MRCLAVGEIEGDLISSNDHRIATQAKGSLCPSRQAESLSLRRARRRQIERQLAQFDSRSRTHGVGDRRSDRRRARLTDP
jgi:hypothetical protein